MSKLHFELLEPKYLEVLKILKKCTKNGVLAGGTALMLQLAFRKSYDLDIFLPKLISKKFLYKIKKYFTKIKIIVDTGDEFSFVSIDHGIKISFIYYPYHFLYKTVATEYFTILNWRDIALDKAHTIGRRAEWRDYIDFYFILKQGFSLKNILKQAKKKFGDSFSEKLFLAQLSYLEDIKDFTIEFIDKKYSNKLITKNTIKNFFEQEIKRIKFK